MTLGLERSSVTVIFIRLLTDLACGYSRSTYAWQQRSAATVQYTHKQLKYNLNQGINEIS